MSETSIGEGVKKYANSGLRRHWRAICKVMGSSQPEPVIFATGIMNFSPVNILSSLRFTILLSIFLASIPSLVTAQVKASFLERPDPRGFEKTIEISWSAEEEQAWRTENEGRLEIMGLRTQIPANVLNHAGVLEYHLEFAEPGLIECLILIQKVDPKEEIWLKNKKGEKLLLLNPPGRTRLLTPAFDPEEVSIVRSKVGKATGQSEISIETIYYQPRTGDRGVLDIGFNTAFPCHPNAACKTDSLSKLISNTEVRIRLVHEEGIGWCTGAIVNNTRNDKTPYLLTAYHCTFNYTPLYDQWRFDFQYKSETCANPATEPTYFSMTGCELKASGQGSDFLLVLLVDDIPTDQQVTFAGWDRNDTSVPDTTYLVHHPNADIRKFSTSTNPIVIHPNQIGWSEGYTTPAHHHFRFKFSEGGHQPGSSGGPIFNENFLLVGQLHGGSDGCETDNNAYVGRLSKSWNYGNTPAQRLREWLDPDNTGVLQLPSLENINSSDMVDLHGIVKDGLDRPVKNVKVQITGSATEELVTDADGKFQLRAVNRNGQYTISFDKNENQANGLNVFDLLSIQKHILAVDVFDHPWQLIAADATNNQDITVGDILVLLKLILGKITYLPSSPSWRFDPPQIQLESLPPGPQEVIQTMGVKIGDVNGNSDPAQ